MYIKKIMNTIDRTIFFFSFGIYAFAGFQIHIDQKIYTKVKNTSSTFRIKFSNQKPTPLEH
jgi:hypothetical protein